jgi:hypothetical protein
MRSILTVGLFIVAVSGLSGSAIAKSGSGGVHSANPPKPNVFMHYGLTSPSGKIQSSTVVYDGNGGNTIPCRFTCGKIVKHGKGDWAWFSIRLKPGERIVAAFYGYKSRNGRHYGDSNWSGLNVLMNTIFVNAPGGGSLMKLSFIDVQVFNPNKHHAP